MSHHSQRLIAGAAVAIALALGGCASSPALTNRGLESIHQPVVRFEHFPFDADTRGGDLPPAEAARLAGWFEALGLRYGDQVAIDTNRGDSGLAVRDGVAAVAARRGVLLAREAPLTAGAVSPGFTRIVLSRATARVDGCPNWGDHGALGGINRTSANYGCATNANLAAMIADPADLVRGQSSSRNDPLTSARAINAYRNGASPGGSGASASGSAGASRTSTGSSGGGQ